MVKNNANCAQNPDKLLRELFVSPHLLSLHPDCDVQKKLNIYLDMLEKWNKALNLTGFKSRSQILKNLVLDSFHLAHFLNCENFLQEDCHIADLGSGAGLPAIPLRMVWQNGNFSLVEISSRRALFLENILARLELPRTTVHNCSAEEFLRDSITYPHCIISRAFKPWRELLKMCHTHIYGSRCMIILANTSAPEMPPDWRLINEYGYHIAGVQRWFWRVQPVLDDL